MTALSKMVFCNSLNKVLLHLFAYVDTENQDLASIFGLDYLMQEGWYIGQIISRAKSCSSTILTEDVYMNFIQFVKEQLGSLYL